MDNILEKLKVEKRSYVTDVELATFLDLDLDDVIVIIEKTSEKVNKFFKDENFTINLEKEVGKYILDRKIILFLLPEVSHYPDNIRYKIIDLIRSLYLTLYVNECNIKIN